MSNQLFQNALLLLSGRKIIGLLALGCVIFLGCGSESPKSNVNQEQQTDGPHNKIAASASKDSSSKANQSTSGAKQVSDLPKKSTKQSSSLTQSSHSKNANGFDKTNLISGVSSEGANKTESKISESSEDISNAVADESALAKESALADTEKSQKSFDVGFSAATLNLKVGETAELGLKIQGFQQKVSAFNLILKFDSTKLELVDFKLGPNFENAGGQFMPQVVSKLGLAECSYVIFSENTIALPDGELFRFLVHAKSAGTSLLEFTEFETVDALVREQKLYPQKSVQITVSSVATN